MVFDKKTRDELMNDELIEDKKREFINEIDDGAMDSWIMDNYETLVNCFLSDYNDEWVSYCKEKWREDNEE